MRTLRCAMRRSRPVAGVYGTAHAGLCGTGPEGRVSREQATGLEAQRIEVHPRVDLADAKVHLSRTPSDAFTPHKATWQACATVTGKWESEVA